MERFKKGDQITLKCTVKEWDSESQRLWVGFSGPIARDGTGLFYLCYNQDVVEWETNNVSAR